MMRRLAACVVALALLCAACASAEDYYRIDENNQANFGVLLSALLSSYEQPSDGDAAYFDWVLEAIGSINATDLTVARSVVDHWKAVYLDPDYPMYLYDGGERAAALEASNPQIRERHAFVVLGFELKDGEMTDELKGRCEAAAAAARSYPESILVCSGGATGDNNPEGHTEAGMMKAYLTEMCGIAPDRIYIDENAMTTLQNAVNTFEIMRAQGVDTMTIVTSAYHQRWSQVLYNAMSTLCALSWGYSARIVANYSFPIAPPAKYAADDRFAIRQLASMLGLPKDAVDMP